MASPPYVHLLRGREKYLLRTRVAEPVLRRTLGAVAAACRKARGGASLSEIRSPARLLVVHRIRIGDAVVITPLLRALKARFPETELTLVASPVVADFMRRAPGVDRVIPFAPRRGEGVRRAAARAAEMAGPSGLAFVLDFTPLSVRIARRAGAAVRIGYDDHGRGFGLTHTLPWPAEWARATADYPAGLAPRHQAERWLALGTLVGASDADPQPRLAVNRDAAWESLLPGAGFPEDARVLLIHPGSDPAYRWRPERWAEITDALSQRHALRVVISGGPEDGGVVDRVRGLLKTDAFDILKAGLETALDIAGRAELVVTVDTCLGHFASAAGTPAIVLSGPADPRIWRPYGKAHVVMSDPSARCGGCKQPRCALPSHLCMDGIEAAAVLRAAEDILAHRDKT